ncbi:hypothetical protein B1209_07425 [Raoultella planticola]|jgi:hypothetical protein|nr:hypothetical protein CRT62_07335 [Raoultella planticola]KFD09002.1 hypothetical protein GRPL_02349 [Raoultella planticola ATCC 33531]ATM13403.1 hypothetical protein CRN15_00285 [Raoultella planticola]AUU02463.1 hypothetical protein MC50_000655 [Raoultella planticola]AUV52676.1 hypothetical protein B1209_07425 [Raoultella planticola]
MGFLSRVQGWFILVMWNNVGLFGCAIVKSTTFHFPFSRGITLQDVIDLSYFPQRQGGISGGVISGDGKCEAR